MVIYLLFPVIAGVVGAINKAIQRTEDIHWFTPIVLYICYTGEHISMLVHNWHVRAWNASCQEITSDMNQTMNCTVKLCSHNYSRSYLFNTFRKNDLTMWTPSMQHFCPGPDRFLCWRFLCIRNCYSIVIHRKLAFHIVCRKRPVVALWQRISSCNIDVVWSNRV